MGVAAMLVMDMAVIVASVVMAVRDMDVGMGIAVMMMIVVMDMSVMRRGHRQCRPLRLQRAHKTAALGPDQPGAERRDQGRSGPCTLNSSNADIGSKRG